MSCQLIHLITNLLFVHSLHLSGSTNSSTTLLSVSIDLGLCIISMSTFSKQSTHPTTRIKLVRNNRGRFCQVQCSNELLLDIREELGPLVAGQHIEDDRSSVRPCCGCWWMAAGSGLAGTLACVDDDFSLARAPSASTGAFQGGAIAVGLQWAPGK